MLSRAFATSLRCRKQFALTTAMNHSVLHLFKPASITMRALTTNTPPESNLHARLSPLVLPEMSTEPVIPAPDQVELEKLMEPLRQRTWSIVPMVPNDGFNKIDEESAFLTRKIRFKGPVSARKFVTELMKIEDEEKHHISFNLWSGKRPILSLFIQTHSAQVGNETRPAITSRDVRLAVRLESFLDDSQLTFKGGRVEDA